MAVIGELIVKLRAESAVFSQQMEQARRTTQRTGQSFTHFGNEGAKGFRKASNAVTTLGLGMVGLTGKAGRLTEGLLMMGAGGAVTLGLTAGIAAIVLAYRHFTSAATKAKEAQDKLIESAKARLENTAIATELAVNYKQALDLKRKIAQLEGRSDVQNALDPFGVFGGGKKLAALKGELAATEALIAQLNVLFKEEWTKAHKPPKDAFDWFGVPPMDDIKEMLSVIADARAKLADHASWISETIKAQREATKDRLGDSIMGHFEQVENRTFLIQRPKVFERMERDAELWKESWINAIRGVQEAFANFFDSIGQEGFRLVSILEDIAKVIRRILAELAAQRVVNWLLGGAVSGLGGGSRGNLTQSQSMAPSLARPTPAPVVVHQNIRFNAGFIDGATGAQWLQSQGGTIAGIVGQAAADAPAFARYIVAQGSR